MTESPRALLNRVVDYAGLFPPASLSLEQSAANFATYRNSPESWMLGTFVCPAQRLPELADLCFDRQAPVAALVATAAPASAAAIETGNQLAQVRAFQRTHRCKVFELNLAPILDAGINGAGWQQIRAAMEAIATSLPGRITCFFEFPAAQGANDQGAWNAQLRRQVEAIAEVASQFKGRCRVGFKFRTGGTQAAAFPSARRVAQVICECRDAGICWKATAGLHHAVRRFDSELGCPMHGFLNVLFASVFATVHQLPPAQLIEILDDTAADNFRFDQTGLRWRGFTCPTAQVVAARQSSLASFGSCSFAEPTAELQTLGLLSSSK